MVAGVAVMGSEKRRRRSRRAFDDPKACGFIGGDGDRGGVS
jgi:hypothetical protein